MKKFFGLCALTTGFIFGLSTGALAASGNLKIGYVDSQAAAGQSQWGKRIGESVKADMEQLGGQVDQKRKTVKAAIDEFDKKKDVMDQKARDRKQRELQTQMSELQRLQSENEAKYQKALAEKVSPISQKVQEVIAKIGRDDKYDFILEKAAVPFANDRDDITKKVAAELDRVAPK